VGICGLLCAFADSLPVLLVLRFLVGVGVGASPAALCLYSEYLPPAKRGSNIILFLFFFSIGAVTEALVAWATLPGEYPRLFPHPTLCSALFMCGYFSRV
jgi:putative MFS transporter